MSRTHTAVDLRAVSLAERPDLIGEAVGMPTAWTEFVLRSPMLAMAGWIFERHPEYQTVLIDGDGRVVARAEAVPFPWDGDPGSLPANGWDGALALAAGAAFAGDGAASPAVCLLEAAVVDGMRGRGVAARMIDAVRGRMRDLGHRDMAAPVRPTGKEPGSGVGLADYAARVRGDGLPEDPWLRLHVRLGARIAGVCPASMTIGGGLAQWREWTGLPFDADGPVEVPGGLVPVVADTAADQAVYVEPNVWVHHRL
ncbi:N-acetyltransferase [Nocardiopsis sp. RSe5-2]|uniref:N-acetyltransferase n=1 Tax=Nocardiopsis endophytica TaxID=3018445 RepID=A0ABT4UD06_9ACTN|nr:N-acetyltransferase [Nocardiopsis endophytica]MDA2814235.1 N-acetyltransferase [Nocardiopsis endophytica]